MKKKSKKINLKITRGEKLLFLCAIFLTVGILLTKVFCGALEGNLSIDVERLKFEISNEEKKIESLSMQISELTSYDKIKDVVKGMGLTYNHENIIVVNK